MAYISGQMYPERLINFIGDDAAWRFHANVLIGDYWWISTRESTTIDGVTGASVVRINVNTFEYEIIIPVNSTGTGMQQFNDMASDDTHVWVTGWGDIIRFNKNDINDYTVFRANTGNEVISVDDTYVYTSYNEVFHKYEKAILIPHPAFNSTFESVDLTAHSNGKTAHAMFLDDETGYVWLSMTTGSQQVQSKLLGVDTSVMTTVGLKTLDIPVCTDDVGFDGQYLYMASESNDPVQAWYDQKVVAVDINPLPAGNPTAYFMGDPSLVPDGKYYSAYWKDGMLYLLHALKGLYLIDPSTVTSWNTVDNPQTENWVLAGYGFRDIPNDPFDWGVPNEMTIIPSGRILVTLWGVQATGGSVFEYNFLDDFNVGEYPYLSNSSGDPTTWDTVDVDSELIQIGTSAITARGFVYGTDPDDLSTEVVEGGTATSTFSDGIEGLDPEILYYFKSFADNTEGRGYGELFTATTLERVSEISGKITYKGSNIENAKILCIDQGDNTLAGSELSDASGDYLISGLVTTHKYVVLSYFNTDPDEYTADVIGYIDSVPTILPITDIYNGDFAIETTNQDAGWVYTSSSSQWLWEDNRGGYTCIKINNGCNTFLSQQEGHKIQWEDNANYRLNWYNVDDDTGANIEVYAGDSLMFVMSNNNGAEAQTFQVGVGEVDGIRFKGTGGRWMYFTDLVLTKL